MALYLEADRMASFKVTEEIYKTERKVVAEEWRHPAEPPYGTHVRGLPEDGVHEAQLPLDADRQHGPPQAARGRTSFRSSSTPTTCRTTRCWSSPATSTSRRRKELVQQVLRLDPAGPEP